MDMNLGDTQLILHECRTRGLLRNQAACILGNTYWETAHTMEPVRETLAASDEQAISRLDRWWETKRPSWVKTPYWRDGFFGRGYVQLTHKRNYAFAGEKLGINLVAQPGLALEAETAATILVRGCLEGWFTGKKLSDYLTLTKSDYVGARRIINGTNKAQAIAELCRDYEAQLLADGYGTEKPAPVVNEKRDGRPPRTTQLQSTTQLTTVGAGLATLSSLSEQAKNTIAVVTDGLGVSPEAALAFIALACLGWIFRERLRKWAEGDR